MKIINKYKGLILFVLVFMVMFSFYKNEIAIIREQEQINISERR